MTWRRYRFYTKAVDDYRPLLFNPAYPWWCSGITGDGLSAIIVAYLPAAEPLEHYWDDASEISYTDEETITFSDRFPKPEYYRKEGTNAATRPHQLS